MPVVEDGAVSFFFIRTYNLFKPARNEYLNKTISLNDGSLGSLNDEERSEMRYVM